MATAVLVIAKLAAPGASIFGSAGANFALFAAASVIDQAFIIPHLLPGPDSQGPKLDGQNLQSASEGSPIAVCMGSQARVAGTVIYLSDQRDVTSAPEALGKGGGYEVAATEKEVDVAILVCQTEGDPIEAIDRIWTGGKLFMVNDPDVSGSETTISAEISADGKMQLRQTGLSFDELTTSLLGSLSAGFPAAVSGFPALGTWAGNIELAAGAVTGATTITVRQNPIAFFAGDEIVAGDRFTLNGSTYPVKSVTFNVTQATITINPAGLDNIVTTGMQLTSPTSSLNGLAKNVLSVTYAGTEVVVKFGHNFPQVHAAGNSITISQEKEDFPLDNAEAVTIYRGSDGQNPDPFLESVFGTDEEPAYRQCVYFVIQGLNEKDYGNFLPNFTARVRAKTTPQVKDTVDFLIERARIPSSMVDTSDLDQPDLFLQGYQLKGPQPTSQALQPVLLSKNLITYEKKGVVHFVRRDQVPTKTIPESDLGARILGELGDYPAVWEDSDDVKVPRELQVLYQDPNMDQQEASTIARVGFNGFKDKNQDFPLYGLGNVTQSINLGLVLAETEANKLGRTLLLNAHAARQRGNLSLPPSHIDVHENMKLSLTSESVDYELLTNVVDLGANQLIEVESIVEDSDSTDLEEVEVGSPVEGDLPIDYPAPVVLFLLDGPALRDDHTSVGGYYAALASYQAGAWRGGALFESRDGSQATYRQIAEFRKEALGGAIAAAVPSGPTTVWDESTTINVELYDPTRTLETVPELECLNGVNRAAIIDPTTGNCEIIGFKNAVLQGDGTYNVSGLLRGLRGTNWAVDQHLPYAQFLVLDSAVQWIPKDFTRTNTRTYVKPVSGGLSVTLVDPEDYFLQGRTLHPFSVANVASSRNASLDIAISWDPRPRSMSGGLPGRTPPLVERDEEYEVDVLDGSGGSVVRTITSTASANGSVVSARTATYDAADQTADGLTAGAPTYVKIYQISRFYGRGNTREELV